MRYWEMVLIRVSVYWTAIRWLAALVMLYYAVRLIALALVVGVTDDILDLATLLLLALLVVSRPPRDLPPEP